MSRNLLTSGARCIEEIYASRLNCHSTPHRHLTLFLRTLVRIRLIYSYRPVTDLPEPYSSILCCGRVDFYISSHPFYRSCSAKDGRYTTNQASRSHRRRPNGPGHRVCLQPNLTDNQICHRSTCQDSSYPARSIAPRSRQGAQEAGQFTREGCRQEAYYCRRGGRR